MKNQAISGLRQELIAAGADESEARELVRLAASMRELKPRYVATPKKRAGGRSSLAWRFGLPAMAIAVLAVIIVSSQTVLPGSRLYTVQKFSDSVAVKLHPAYRGTVMMRRARDVKLLVASHAPSNVVLATLQDYQHEAAAYANTRANYAVFENCKGSLSRAASLASGPERQAINKSLDDLRDV